MNHSSKTVSLFSRPFLDTFQKSYNNIVVLNMMPEGPLRELVGKVSFPNISEFQQSSCATSRCGLALRSFRNNHCGCHYMTTDEVPDLISYLMCNQYDVNTSITKMFNSSDIRFDNNVGSKLICFISYKG